MLVSELRAARQTQLLLPHASGCLYPLGGDTPSPMWLLLGEHMSVCVCACAVSLGCVISRVCVAWR